MIFDRTITDVNTAKLLRAKVQSGQSLTVNELAAIERGTCTITMLNRIEDKTAEIKGLLDKYGYYTGNIVTHTHTHSEILTENGIARMLLNIGKLRQAFFVNSNTPATPTDFYTYRTANDTEKIIYDIESMLDSMLSFFRQCGTFQCGEENT